MVARTRKKTAVEASVVDLARERVRHAFELFDHVAVSFSGGKDSTAVLNLTLEAARELGRLPLRVFFWDEEAIPYQTEEYVRRVGAVPDVALEWYCVPVKHRNACSHAEPWWYPWAPEDRERWVREIPPEATTEIPGLPTEPGKRLTIPEANGLLFPPELGTCGVVMGIRSQESLTRLRAILRGRRTEPYVVPYEGKTGRGNTHKVYPIYDWQTQDVWTAPKVFGWDTNEAYDAMEMAGLGHADQRCAPPYGEEPMRGLHNFKVAFPEIWDKMAYRVEGAATAARYSSTELYGFGSLPPKPPEHTWESYLKLLVGRFRPVERKQVAHRLQHEIRLHYQKTGDPILEVPHPLTGLSWRFLQQVAIRGDLKGRKVVLRYSEANVGPGVRVRYDEALKAHQEQGEANERRG